MAYDSLEKIKSLLKKEPNVLKTINDFSRSHTNEKFKLDKKKYFNRMRSVIPIIHNQDRVYLQFRGWCITLLKDGSYFWEGTDGG